MSVSEKLMDIAALPERSKNKYDSVGEINEAGSKRVSRSCANGNIQA